MQVAVGTERWGDFVLAESLEGIDQTLERQGPRVDFRWPEGPSPFTHPNAHVIQSEAEARREPLLPFPSQTPAGTEFQSATILADSAGVAETIVTYIRPELKTVELQRIDGTKETRPATPDDATVTIYRSLRLGTPMFISPLSENASTSPATVILEETRKIEVNGHKGVMRLYRPKDGGDSYRYRIPSVALNWFEGEVHYAVQTHFMSPGEALSLAESIQTASGR